MSSKSVLVVIPCYKRPEYTARCLDSILKAQEYGEEVTFLLIDDGSQDGTAQLLRDFPFKKVTWISETNHGLRRVLVDVFKYAQESGFYYIVKMDNDCKVPKNWLSDIISSLETGLVDIVSPNVNPSNAAYTYGKKEEPNEPGLRRSKIVGGLWAMPVSLLSGLDFEAHEVGGIKGAFHLLNQIILEKEPRVAWLPHVIVQDIGHWSGEHPEHISSKEHRDYSIEVGRNIAW